MRCSPFHLSRVSAQIQEILLALAAAEIINCSVLLDIHEPRAAEQIVPAKTALWHIQPLALISFASRSVFNSTTISPFLRLPFTFLRLTLPTSGPSSILHSTCLISPYTPVRFTTSTTSAGVPFSLYSAILISPQIHFLCSASISFFASPSSRTAIAAVPTTIPAFSPSSFLLGADR